MARKTKDLDLQSDMCGRLIHLTEAILCITRKELSERLGYRNPSTLWHVWNKKAFPDVEKLQILSEMNTIDGQRPNIDWIISGKGSPLVKDMDYIKKPTDSEVESRILQILSKMPNQKKVHLLGILQNDS